MARREDGAPHGRLNNGGLVDPTARRAFIFDGKAYEGFAGDTLASALLANGVRLVGRSFKYHRPRGVLTAGSEEPNALVELRAGARREPNTRATSAELFEGLEARSQNRWPSLAFDLGALNSLMSPIFVAGFYYKTFMWPASFWEKLYEPAIRRAAGLGRASLAPDPDAYEKAHAFCDLLVIGGGPAGLSAALAAGRAGARVILAEEDFVLGGRLNGDRHEIDGVSGRDWAAAAEAELAALPEVRIMRRTSVFGAYDGGVYGAIERLWDHVAAPPAHQPRQRYWKIVARRVALAAGAIERPIVFGGNDRPGVMMASAVRTYANRFGVAAGRAIALFTTTDDGWRTAVDLAAAGVSLAAIVDARQEVDRSLLAAGEKIAARVFLGARVVDTRGRLALSGLTVRDSAGRISRLTVDALAMSGGWNPNLALSTHLGSRPRWADAIAAFIPETPPPGMSVVGAAAGAFTLAEALRQGAAAGSRAAWETGFSPAAAPLPRTDDEPCAMAPLWHVASRGKAFVDFQNDVTADDVALSAREGFRAVEHLKRYTTLGMATDQGKSSNVNGLAIMAALTQQAIPEIGTTAYRPPYAPVAIGALAGAHRGADFRPTRRTPGHDWAQERGADFAESGPWLRARWFAKPGETEWLASVSREVLAVRGNVGVCDSSTLGKIDIQGVDAGVFLDRVYSNLFSSLPIGKARYGLMLREDGCVMDDGVTARFGENRFLMSTTTANAAKVMEHLEHAREILWPDLDVQLASVTDQWAQYAIAGPRSRAVLQRLLGEALDVTDAAFPYLACAEFVWRGVDARLFRISFSGELAFELAVPARYGDSAIRAIMEAGASCDMAPYGLEALNVMRTEKGHVAGAELDGTTTAADLGLGRLMSTRKDFIGRVLAGRHGMADPKRPSLIGVAPVDAGARLRAGAQLLRIGDAATLDNIQGRLTSTAFSPSLGHWIALGLLAHGAERIGERLRAYDPLRDGDTEVEVRSPVFYDPKGERLHG